MMSSSSTSTTLRISSEASAASICARLKYTTTLPTDTGRMLVLAEPASRNTSSAWPWAPFGGGWPAGATRRPSAARDLPANSPTALS